MRSHANPQISAMTGMIALPWPRELLAGLQIDLQDVSVARDSSSGACASPEQTAAKAPRRSDDRLAGGSDGRRRANHDGGS